VRILFSDKVEKDAKRAALQMLLYWFMVTFLVIMFLLMWHGDAQRYPLALTYAAIWGVVGSGFLALSLLPYYVKRFPWPFGNYPRHRNLGLSGLVGVGAALLLIFVSAGIQRVMSRQMGFVAMPSLVEALRDLLWFLPKTGFKPIILDWLSGVVAFFWQGVVSGVEEGMKIALTLVLAFGIAAFVKHRRDKHGTGELSGTEKAVILAFAVLVVGISWDLWHGFHAYSTIAEFASAFAAHAVLSLVTFWLGNPFPAFIAHWTYNVMAPAISAAIVQAFFTALLLARLLGG